MTDDQRRMALARMVAECVTLEREIEETLGRGALKATDHSEAAAAMERFRAMARNHQDALGGCVGAASEFDPGDPQPTAVASLPALTEDGSGSAPLSEMLRRASTAFAYAATSYGMLAEAALFLYEPPLRALAPRHLRDYAEAAQETNQLLADVVAWEFVNEGLECTCVCPMCGVGACGCVAGGTELVNRAWRETAPGEGAGGVPLSPPKARSQLLAADVRSGDRLVAVDGVEVQRPSEVLAAMRKHQIGEEVRLQIQRGPDDVREIVVQHASDYPGR